MSNPFDKFDDWLTNAPNEEIDEETISDRIKEYMSEGNLWYPYDWENFCDAINSATKNESEEILDWAKHKNYSALGLYIWSLVQEKNEKHAESYAMDDYNKGLIGDDRE